MKTKLAGFVVGIGAGFVLSWSGLSDPAVVRDMLLVRDTHPFLIMGSAVVVAAVGVRLLRAAAARSILTGERIDWSVEKPRLRHVGGSVLFAVGWSVAGTCPGPVAAMIGEGRLGGLVVAAGLITGVTLQRRLARRRASDTPAPIAAVV